MKTWTGKALMPILAIAINGCGPPSDPFVREQLKLIRSSSDITDFRISNSRYPTIGEIDLPEADGYIPIQSYEGQKNVLIYVIGDDGVICFVDPDFFILNEDADIENLTREHEVLTREDMDELLNHMKKIDNLVQ